MSRQRVPRALPDPVPGAVLGAFVGIVLFALPEPWMWVPGFAAVALGASPLGRGVVRRAPVSATWTLLLLAVLAFLLNPAPWLRDNRRAMLFALAAAVAAAGAWLQWLARRRRVPVRPHAGWPVRLLGRSPLAFQALLALLCWLPCAAAQQLGGRPLLTPGVVAAALVAALLAAFLWESSALPVATTLRGGHRRAAPSRSRATAALR